MAGKPKPAGPERIIVATILAVGLVLGVLLIDFAVMWRFMQHGTTQIPEPLGQIMIASVAGMVGLLGGYLGVRVGRRGEAEAPDAVTPPTVYEPPEESTPTSQGGAPR
jgi:hypothetical protein